MLNWNYPWTAQILLFFHFEDSGWGQQRDSNFDYEETQWQEPWESATYNAAPTLWYGDALDWDQNQGNEWEAHATSTWQSEHLPDGSANNDIQEEKEKERLIDISEDHVGLTIEEDEDVNQSEESSYSGSPEEI